jgi:hypothetical protein
MREVSMCGHVFAAACGLAFAAFAHGATPTDASTAALAREILAEQIALDTTFK